jgi:hypothetical protein
MNSAAFCPLILLALAVSPPANCDEASLEAMKQRCQEAREKQIAPLREAAIEECASRHRSSRTRADCERMYADFGEGGGTVGGGSRPAMFIGLPECVEYFEAQDLERNGRSRR